MSERLQKTAGMVLVLLCMSMSLYAAEHAETVIDSVYVTGIGADEDAAGGLLSVRGGVLNDGYIGHDIALITTGLRERGYWRAGVRAKIDTLSAGHAVVTYVVALGRRVRFGRITVIPENGGDIPDIPDRYGEPFVRADFEAVMNDIVNGLVRRGYPDVTVTPGLTSAGDTVHVALSVVSGERALVDSIAITGLTRTDENVILREMRQLIGRPAGGDVLSEVRGIIDRIGYVHANGEADIRYDGGAGVMTIPVSEGSQGAFDGVLGWQPEENGRSGGFVGRIDLDMQNIFGTGRSSRFRWERLGEQSEDLDVAYTEPWVFGHPYSVTGAFSQEEREGLGYVKTMLSFGVGRAFGNLAVDASYRYEKVSADSLTSTHGSGFGAGVSWTVLDNRRNPSRGVRYGLVWSMVSKKYRFGRQKDTDMERLLLEFDQYIPVRDHQTFAALLRYQRLDIPDENLTAADRYWLGGATTIRGHREDQFPAVKALWGSAEYRFLTGEASRVFVFFDAGWLSDRREAMSGWKDRTTTVTGYGFGLRITSRAGVLGFDYGLGRGDGPGDGKLHVGMRTEF